MIAAAIASRTKQAAQAKAPSAARQEAAPETTHTVFSNPSGIFCPDRPSNNAGTSPGLPPLYPSTINVVGLAGIVTKVTVSFQATSTFPDDLDILLVGPTGARSLIISDAGGATDIVGVGYTFDQTAATAFPDTTLAATGVYRPANYLGFATPEPGGVDNFPAPGPGLLNYPTNLNVFNSTNPNGVWSLYVVDDQNLDVNNSLPNGWAIDITVVGACNTAKRPIDMDGDGDTDFQVVRNTGGGSGGQVTWFTLLNGGAQSAQPWGISTDEFVPSDYDGDGKTDIAVWRGAAPENSYFYILQSSTNTLRAAQFGQAGDDPSMIGDYDGDGKVDPAVYRGGASVGDHSFWYYLSSATGLQTLGAEWGQNGDFPVPGDFDGDGKYDFVVQRNEGGQGRFYRRLSTGTTDSVVFGTSSDTVVPGYYDADCRGRSGVGWSDPVVRPEQPGWVDDELQLRVVGIGFRVAGRLRRRRQDRRGRLAAERRLVPEFLLLDTLDEWSAGLPRVGCTGRSADGLFQPPLNRVRSITWTASGRGRVSALASFSLRRRGMIRKCAVGVCRGG